LLLVLAVASPAAAKRKHKKPAPAAPPATRAEVAVVHAPDGWRADLSFDGPLLGWAMPRTGAGHRAMYFLVGTTPSAPAPDAAAPCDVSDPDADRERTARLFTWRPEAPETLQPLGSALPAGSLDEADLDGDGVDELLLLRPGAIDLVTISPDGTVTTPNLVTDEGIGAACCGPRTAWDEAASRDDVLRLALLGAFRTYRRDGKGVVALASELPIPQRAVPGFERVRVQSPAIHPIGRASNSRMVFATDPEPLGKRRLRTLLLDPDGPQETRVIESWALFPEPERVVDSAFSILDGAPVLIVTTTSAEKLALLSEKALRIYPLSGDRTRAGDVPAFAATTGLNLWQQAHPAVVDLDGDGRDELVLAYWKGLTNTIAALEVYRGGAGSSFAKPRSMSFDVDNGEKGFLEFGADADGDGRPDLVLVANGQLLVYPGLPAARAAEKPVDTHPSRRIPLPADLPRPRGMTFSMGTDGFQVSRAEGGLGTPHLLDLDGDARPEAVFAGDGASGGRAVVVFFRGSSAVAPSATLSRE
jgi:FG-GAP-like repeat